MKPPLMKNTKFNWNRSIEIHFQHIKNQVAKATEGTLYNPNLETWIKCNASVSGLGAAFEQRLPTGLHTVALHLIFFNSNEARYLFGKSLPVITDHRALLLIMKEYRYIKSRNNSRLIGLVDGLVTTDSYNGQHPGAKKE